MATPPEVVEERRAASGAQVGLVAGLLVLVLVILWFLFLRGGGEAEVAAPPPAPAPTVAPEPSPTPQKPGKGRVETFDVFAPKDPFKPAVVLGAAAGAGTTGGTTAGGTTANGGAAGGTAGGETGGTGTGATGGGQRGGTDVSGHRVRLVDVFTQNGEQRAQVQVDGTVYTVEEGETFAENFKLLSISGRCASLLFGDDQFTLCEGEEILK